MRPAVRTPEQLTSFIGRDHELAALLNLLARGSAVTRLVTLTGPPGTGKTRLAVRVAADLNARGEETWFVPLASIRDPTLVGQAIAQVVGVGELSRQSVAERVIAFLESRPGLLVLDNFEHILAGAPLVARLLEHCPQLKVLVTSRAPLRLYGEQEFLVPPLPLPDAQPAVPLQALLQSDAVKLFVARVQAVEFEFRLTDANGHAIAEICRRLDGLPLAIELAAARSKTLSPQALLGRLGDRLSLLTIGPRDRSPRQRTLRAAIDWSHELLSPAEQTLFRRLAIFVDGCTLETATAICTVDTHLGGDVFERLTSLVDQSLLQLKTESNGEPRFRMLESIREYAWERLVGSADFDLIRQRHAEVFLGLAEAAEPELHGPQQTVWRDRLQREMPNLRSAFRWALAGDKPQPGLRAAAALWLFWFVRGFTNEGRRWLSMLLEHPRASDSGAARARALFTAGMLAFYQRDSAAGRALHEEGLALQQQLGDRAGIASALFGLGQVAFDGGDLPRARALHEEAMQIRSELGDPWQIAFSAGNLAMVVRAQGDAILARQLIEQSVVIRRQLGDHRATAGMLFMLARLIQETGDYTHARALYRESLEIARGIDDRWALGHELANLVSLAAAEGRWSLALRLHAAATTASHASETALFPGVRERVDHELERARGVLGPVAAAAALAQGRDEDVDALMNEVLNDVAPAYDTGVAEALPALPLGTHASSGMPLTRREREVAGLIARGYTNREVARALSIAERTAATHVEHILDKLHVTSRSQIAAWTAARLS
jgi:predicted ATPase/DNA-binding CsgD family transcriptional regulator